METKKIKVEDIDWNFAYNQVTMRSKYFKQELKDKADNITRVKECISALDKIEVFAQFCLENM